MWEKWLRSLLQEQNKHKKHKGFIPVTDNVIGNEAFLLYVIL